MGIKKQAHIKRVSPKKLTDLIEHRTPLGLFLTKEGRIWVAVDNTTGDAWTEEFSCKRQSVRWLRGKFEVSDQVAQWNRINNAESLIMVATQQGITLTVANNLFVDCRENPRYGGGFMDFHGNRNEVSAAFHYRIYDKALIERIRAAVAPIIERSRRDKHGHL